MCKDIDKEMNSWVLAVSSVFIALAIVSILGGVVWAYIGHFHLIILRCT